MNLRNFLTLLVFTAFTALPAIGWGVEPAGFDGLARDFDGGALPLVKRHCLKCHSTKRQEGDLDLERFTDLDRVRGDRRVWQKVGEMLDAGQMPPPEARQPTEAERARLKQWVPVFRTAEAHARAGDPGRVVLRRLSNAEYTYTLRDLTGVDALDPAREFPADGAAGEGFTNTGGALVMSPVLVTKYLDAAKEVASHAVLLPDGFRFSPRTTPRDWTEETLAAIRAFYREYTDASGGAKVNLQGIVFDTNQGGRLPLEKYLAATLAERDALTRGAKSIETVARERGLNAKYLGTLWESLSGPESSLLVNGLRARWRAAKTEDAAALAADVAAWQKGLWRFSTVGHIGKVGGPKAWLEPVTPLIAKQEVRFKVPASTDGKEVTVSLVASDAGDGNAHDFVVWQRPRLVAPGRPDLLLRDVGAVARDLAARRERTFSATARYLAAASEIADASGKMEIEELARKHGVEADALRAWLDYLGIGPGGAVEVRGHFTSKLPRNAQYDFIRGWGSSETPLIVANSSDQHVRIPGNMKPHGVAVHPSPTLNAAVGWRSPVTATVRVEAAVTHAHLQWPRSATASPGQARTPSRGDNARRLCDRHGAGRQGSESRPDRTPRRPARRSRRSHDRPARREPLLRPDRRRSATHRARRRRPNLGPRRRRVGRRAGRQPARRSVRQRWRLALHYRARSGRRRNRPGRPRRLASGALAGGRKRGRPARLAARSCKCS